MRIRNFYPSIALLTVLAGLTVGCSKHPNDETIAKDIQSKVAAAPETKDSDVQVTAKDGKVTVTGKAKDPAAQQKIEQIAREEPGTTGVEDQTTTENAAAPGAQEVSQAPPAQAPPPVVEQPKPQPIVVPAGLEDKSDGSNVYRYPGAAIKRGRAPCNPSWIRLPRYSLECKGERQGQGRGRTKPPTDKRNRARTHL
jgi:hypothetical protein